MCFVILLLFFCGGGGGHGVINFLPRPALHSWGHVLGPAVFWLLGFY